MLSDGTALYRIRGGENLLLYIGISDNFGRRWKEHAKKQPWWGEMRSLSVDRWYAERIEAEIAEEIAIRAENPKYNKNHAPVPPRPARPASPPVPRQKPRAATEGEYLSQAQIARALGVTRQALSVWRARYEGTPTPFPAPDVMTGASPGWRASRLDDIRAWRDTLPGQGAGGGRPRRQQG